MIAPDSCRPFCRPLNTSQRRLGTENAGCVSENCLSVESFVAMLISYCKILPTQAGKRRALHSVESDSRKWEDLRFRQDE